MKAKTALIIGGGYTGLSCAVSLIECGYTIFLVEKTQELGGLGSTHKLTNGKECEAFYHHFFTHDKLLQEYCKKFLGKEPIFINSTMAIYYKGRHYAWNGLWDLALYPHISLVGKFRFIIATLLLSFEGVPSSILDRYSLSSGMRILYGKDAYEAVWKPMLKGKFGLKINEIPMRWMQGRLKQRLKSRKSGKEYLGYLVGSLRPLTESVKSYIEKSGRGRVCTSSEIETIEHLSAINGYQITIKDHHTLEKCIFSVDEIIFTIPTNAANMILKTSIGKSCQSTYSQQEYFKAYCVIIELKSSLSEYYWTNIADETLFFCGYIEQTRLTGVEEYGGLHLAYLTKYVSIGENQYNLSKRELEDKAVYCLSKLFPKVNLDESIIGISVKIAKEAQVVTGFGFQPPSMDTFKSQGILLGNMSHVYPDERSINNALEVGTKLAENSTKPL